MTMLCRLHLIIKQHIRRRICIVYEKRTYQETQVLGAVTGCAIVYLGRDSCLAIGDEAEYITTFVRLFLKHLHYSAPGRLCSIYSNTMKWPLRDTERGLN